MPVALASRLEATLPPWEKVEGPWLTQTSLPLVMMPAGIWMVPRTALLPWVKWELPTAMGRLLEVSLYSWYRVRVLEASLPPWNRVESSLPPSAMMVVLVGLLSPWTRSGVMVLPPWARVA